MLLCVAIGGCSRVRFGLVVRAAPCWSGLPAVEACAPGFPSRSGDGRAAAGLNLAGPVRDICPFPVDDHLRLVLRLGDPSDALPVLGEGGQFEDEVGEQGTPRA